MKYIKENGVLIGTVESGQVDIEDLASRDQAIVELDDDVKLGSVLVGEDWVLIKSVEDLELDLMTVCDNWQASATKSVLGYKSTVMQIERYKDKYDRAKAGGFGDAVNTAIIEKHETARALMRNYADMIEAYRELVGDMIETDGLIRAEHAIRAGEQFDGSTTQVDIDAALSGD